jgi:hypothetical protein
MRAAADQVISVLNSIEVGAIERIAGRLEEARRLLADMGQADLVAKLAEADEAIRCGDVPLFRKRLQNVVSRLGHLR